MLPDHCKDVSVRSVDFELVSQEILSHSRGMNAYTRTGYIILKHGREMAVLRVFKSDSKELFQPIQKVEIIALPQDIVYIEDESVDVLNSSQMARISRRYAQKTVVVKGMFSHISFVQPDEYLELHVLDVIPPKPPKLSILVERALGSILTDMPIVPILEEIDLNLLQRSVATPAVIFPCEASGLKSEKRVYYLDQTPEVGEEATLVGCELSGRIYKSLYKKGIARIEMCPQELAPHDGKKRIVKCCQVKEGFEINGSTAVVPWGATVKEVAAAIAELFSHS